MYKSYFKIGWRNLLHQKHFSVIKISGLSIGITCFCLLALYVHHELNFDKFNKNANAIYRPYVWFSAMNGYPAQGYMDYSGPNNTSLGEAMKKSLPEVIDYVRIQLPYDESLVRIASKGFRSTITYADASIFSVFSFSLKYGAATNAMHNLNDIVLTESKAREIFGTDEVVGKTIDIKIGSSFQPFVISAVANDLPENSTIHFDVLGNFLYAEKYVNGNNFTGSDFHYIERQTFVQLKPESKLHADSKILQNFLTSFNPGYLNGLSTQNTPAVEPPVSLRLQPLADIHTSTLNLWHDFPRVDLKAIWILLLIAFGTLLIACINFTTLAAGQSAKRSKEVGIRKVMGAEKNQLITQFMVEAFFFAIISMAIGLSLAYFLLPYFNTLTGTNLHFSVSILPELLLLITVILVFVGLLAGSYPAFVLSSFKPIEVFKNKLRLGGANTFTNSLVTLQFVLSIVSIISTFIILGQTNYMINKSPGFNKNNVVVIDASEADPAKIFPLFKQSMSQNPLVENIGSSAAGMGAGKSYLGYTDQGLSVDINIIDTSYIPVMGMKIVAGLNFTNAQMNDTIKSMIINETMMESFGWTPENAIGKIINNFQGRDAIVTGIVKDFSYHPFDEEIKNQAFITSKDNGYVNFYVRLKPGNQMRAIDEMQKQWNNLMPGIPMKYSFLEDDLNSYYQSEKTWSQIIGSASIISIFLGCLGLLGLTTLATINRTKEIGIRKVLGSTTQSIFLLLSKDILKPVFISLSIAFPVAWWAMNKWLQGFAYHINVSLWIFLVAGVTALLIALLTVSFQSIKAALANPVNSLRTE